MQNGSCEDERRALTLAEDLSACGRLTPARALEWLTPIALSMEQLHERGKALGPFGPADVLRVGEPERSPMSVPGVKRRKDSGVVARRPVVICRGPGSRAAYTAPELMGRARPTRESDVYALAMVAFECLTGSLPPPDARGSYLALPPGEMSDLVFLRAAVRLALASALHPDPRFRDQSPRLVLARFGRNCDQRSP